MHPGILANLTTRRLQHLHPLQSESRQRLRERLWLDHPEQPRERGVAGQTVLQTHELAQKRLVVLRAVRHVDAGLPAAQAR